MEQRPLTQEEPPDAGWRGGGTPPTHNPTTPPHPTPPLLCQDKEKDFFMKILERQNKSFRMANLST